MSKNAGHKNLYRICRVAFLIYVFVIIYVLFFSDRYGRTERFDSYKYNLIPFSEIRRYILNSEYFTVEQFMTNIVGNICLFIPYGAMLFVWKGKPVDFLNVALSSLMLSCIIELMQLVTRVGVCDVDDIIMNTIGGMIGYFIYVFVRTMYRRHLHVKWQKKL